MSGCHCQIGLRHQLAAAAVAMPLTSAITGTGASAIFIIMKGRAARKQFLDKGGIVRSLQFSFKSWPAQNALPDPAITTRAPPDQP